MSTANHRTRATLQIFKYLSGELPRLPKTAVEVYGELVNQSWCAYRPFFQNILLNEFP